jgi:hypothetical protein
MLGFFNSRQLVNDSRLHAGIAVLHDLQRVRRFAFRNYRYPPTGSDPKKKLSKLRVAWSMVGIESHYLSTFCSCRGLRSDYLVEYLPWISILSFVYCLNFWCRSLWSQYFTRTTAGRESSNATAATRQYSTTTRTLTRTSSKSQYAMLPLQIVFFMQRKHADGQTTAASYFCTETTD